jgi:hypothetical protein
MKESDMAKKNYFLETIPRVTAQYWVSIKDWLPESDCRVLVCDREGWVFTGSYENDKWEETSGDECGVEVTHWMPLPNRPFINHRKQMKKPVSKSQER